MTTLELGRLSYSNPRLFVDQSTQGEEEESERSERSFVCFVSCLLLLIRS